MDPLALLCKDNSSSGEDNTDIYSKRVPPKCLTVPQAKETEEKRKNVEQPKKRRRLDQLQKEQFTRSTKKSPVNSRKLRNGKEGEKKEDKLAGQQKHMVQISQEARNTSKSSAVRIDKRREAFQKILKIDTAVEHQTTKRIKRKKNVLDKMESSATLVGPMRVLYECVKEGIRAKVWIRRYNGLRGVITGYIVAFDLHMNLAMIDVKEVFTIETWMLGEPVKKRRQRNKKPNAKLEMSKSGVQASENVEKENKLNVLEENNTEKPDAGEVKKSSEQETQESICDVQCNATVEECDQEYKDNEKTVDAICGGTTDDTMCNNTTGTTTGDAGTIKEQIDRIRMGKNAHENTSSSEYSNSSVLNENSKIQNGALENSTNNDNTDISYRNANKTESTKNKIEQLSNKTKKNDKSTAESTKDFLKRIADKYKSTAVVVPLAPTKNKKEPDKENVVAEDQEPTVDNSKHSDVSSLSKPSIEIKSGTESTNATGKEKSQEKFKLSSRLKHILQDTDKSSMEDDAPQDDLSQILAKALAELKEKQTPSTKNDLNIYLKARRKKIEEYKKLYEEKKGITQKKLTSKDPRLKTKKDFDNNISVKQEPLLTPPPLPPPPLPPQIEVLPPLPADTPPKAPPPPDPHDETLPPPSLPPLSNLALASEKNKDATEKPCSLVPPVAKIKEEPLDMQPSVLPPLPLPPVLPDLSNLSGEEKENTQNKNAKFANSNANKLKSRKSERSKKDRKKGTDSAAIPRKSKSAKGRSGKSSKMKHIASDFENICSSDVEMDENEALPCCQTITHLHPKKSSSSHESSSFHPRSKDSQEQKSGSNNVDSDMLCMKNLNTRENSEVIKQIPNEANSQCDEDLAVSERTGQGDRRILTNNNPGGGFEENHLKSDLGRSDFIIRGKKKTLKQLDPEKFFHLKEIVSKSSTKTIQTATGISEGTTSTLQKYTNISNSATRKQDLPVEEMKEIIPQEENSTIPKSRKIVKTIKTNMPPQDAHIMKEIDSICAGLVNDISDDAIASYELEDTPAFHSQVSVEHVSQKNAKGKKEIKDGKSSSEERYIEADETKVKPGHTVENVQQSVLLKASEDTVQQLDQQNNPPNLNGRLLLGRPGNLNTEIGVKIKQEMLDSCEEHGKTVCEVLTESSETSLNKNEFHHVDPKSSSDDVRNYIKKEEPQQIDDSVNLSMQDSEILLPDEFRLILGSIKQEQEDLDTFQCNDMNEIEESASVEVKPTLQRDYICGTSDVDVDKVIADVSTSLRQMISNEGTVNSRDIKCIAIGDSNIDDKASRNSLDIKSEPELLTTGTSDGVPTSIDTECICNQNAKTGSSSEAASVGTSNACVSINSQYIMERETQLNSGVQGNSKIEFESDFLGISSFKSVASIMDTLKESLLKLGAKEHHLGNRQCQSTENFEDKHAQIDEPHSNLTNKKLNMTNIAEKSHTEEIDIYEDTITEIDLDETSSNMLIESLTSKEKPAEDSVADDVWKMVLASSDDSDGRKQDTDMVDQKTPGKSSTDTRRKYFKTSKQICSFTYHKIATRIDKVKSCRSLPTLQKKMVTKTSMSINPLYQGETSSDEDYQKLKKDKKSKRKKKKEKKEKSVVDIVDGHCESKIAKVKLKKKKSYLKPSIVKASLKESKQAELDATFGSLIQTRSSRKSDRRESERSNISTESDTHSVKTIFDRRKRTSSTERNHYKHFDNQSETDVRVTEGKALMYNDKQEVIDYMEQICSEEFRKASPLKTSSLFTAAQNLIKVKKKEVFKRMQVTPRKSEVLHYHGRLSPSGFERSRRQGTSSSLDYERFDGQLSMDDRRLPHERLQSLDDNAWLSQDEKSFYRDREKAVHRRSSDNERWYFDQERRVMNGRKNSKYYWENPKLKQERRKCHEDMSNLDDGNTIERKTDTKKSQGVQPPGNKHMENESEKESRATEDRTAKEGKRILNQKEELSGKREFRIIKESTRNKPTISINVAEKDLSERNMIPFEAKKLVANEQKLSRHRKGSASAISTDPVSKENQGEKDEQENVKEGGQSEKGEVLKLERDVKRKLFEASFEKDVSVDRDVRGGANMKESMRNEKQLQIDKRIDFTTDRETKVTDTDEIMTVEESNKERSASRNNILSEITVKNKDFERKEISNQAYTRQTVGHIPNIVDTFGKQPSSGDMSFINKDASDMVDGDEKMQSHPILNDGNKQCCSVINENQEADESVSEILNANKHFNFPAKSNSNDVSLIRSKLFKDKQESSSQSITVVQANATVSGTSAKIQVLDVFSTDPSSKVIFNQKSNYELRMSEDEVPEVHRSETPKLAEVHGSNVDTPKLAGVYGEDVVVSNVVKVHESNIGKVKVAEVHETDVGPPNERNKNNDDTDVNASHRNKEVCQDSSSNGKTDFLKKLEMKNDNVYRETNSVKVASNESACDSIKIINEAVTSAIGDTNSNLEMVQNSLSLSTFLKPIEFECRGKEGAANTAGLKNCLQGQVEPSSSDWCNSKESKKLTSDKVARKVEAILETCSELLTGIIEDVIESVAKEDVIESVAKDVIGSVAKEDVVENVAEEDVIDSAAKENAIVENVAKKDVTESVTKEDVLLRETVISSATNGQQVPPSQASLNRTVETVSNDVRLEHDATRKLGNMKKDIPNTTLHSTMKTSFLVSKEDSISGGEILSDGEKSKNVIEDVIESFAKVVFERVAKEDVIESVAKENVESVARKDVIEGLTEEDVIESDTKEDMLLRETIISSATNGQQVTPSQASLNRTVETVSNDVRLEHDATRKLGNMKKDILNTTLHSTMKTFFLVSKEDSFSEGETLSDGEESKNSIKEKSKEDENQREVQNHPRNQKNKKQKKGSPDPLLKALKMERKKNKKNFKKVLRKKIALENSAKEASRDEICEFSVGNIISNSTETAGKSRSKGSLREKGKLKVKSSPKLNIPNPTYQNKTKTSLSKDHLSEGEIRSDGEENGKLMFKEEKKKKHNERTTDALLKFLKFEHKKSKKLLKKSVRKKIALENKAREAVYNENCEFQEVEIMRNSTETTDKSRSKESLLEKESFKEKIESELNPQISRPAGKERKSDLEYTDPEKESDSRIGRMSKGAITEDELETKEVTEPSNEKIIQKDEKDKDRNNSSYDNVKNFRKENNIDDLEEGEISDSSDNESHEEKQRSHLPDTQVTSIMPTESRNRKEKDVPKISERRHKGHRHAERKTLNLDEWDRIDTVLEKERKYERERKYRREKDFQNDWPDQEKYRRKTVNQAEHSNGAAKEKGFHRSLRSDPHDLRDQKECEWQFSSVRNRVGGHGIHRMGRRLSEDESVWRRDKRKGHTEIPSHEINNRNPEAGDVPDNNFLDKSRLVDVRARIEHLRRKRLLREKGDVTSEKLVDRPESNQQVAIIDDKGDEETVLPVSAHNEELNIFQKRQSERVSAAKKRNIDGDIVETVKRKHGPLLLNSDIQEKGHFSRSHIDARVQYDVISDDSEDEVLKEEIYLKTIQAFTIEPQKRIRGSIFKMRFVNQLFIRGDNIVMIAYDKDDIRTK